MTNQNSGTTSNTFPIALRVAVLTVLAMIAFAGNSLLCRAALRDTNIDAASFTDIRILSGAVVLWLIVRSTAVAKRGSIVDV